jgi:MFS family permease
VKRSLLGPLDHYRGLPRSVYVLFLARVVNSMGALVFPFLTLFLTDKLGVSAAQAGRYMLLLALVHIPGSLLGGRLADRLGRKRVLVIGQAVAGAFLLPGAFLGNSMLIPWLLLGGQFFSFLAQPSSQTMVTDLTNPANRPAAFSLLYLGYNLGFAVGPLLAGFLFRDHMAWLFDGFTTFAAAGLTLALVPETRPSREQVAASLAVDSPERAEAGHALQALLARPLLLGFAGLLAVLSFIYVQYGFSLPLQLQELFLDQGPVFYGSLMTVNAVQVILVTAPLVTLTRRRPAALNVAVAAVCYAVGFGMLYLVRSLPLFFLSVVLWTLGEILVTTNASVYIANHTPITHRGRFNALLPLVIGTGQAVSPAVVGQFIQLFSLRLVWVLLFGLALLAGGGLLLLHGAESSRGRSAFRQGAE